MPIDDEVSVVQSLNDSEERTRSPVAKYAKDAISAVGTAIPLLAPLMGVATNALDRREAVNRAELIAALTKKVQEISGSLGELALQSQEQAQFFQNEFPSLVVDALRRAEAVRSKKRIKRFASILTHSLEVGSKDGADCVEEMLRIATELSDLDVKVLIAASKEFARQEDMGTKEAKTMIAARAWTTMKTGISGDERYVSTRMRHTA